MLIVGYSTAYIFHILSCGYFFRFVEFKDYSYFVDSHHVDRGGPNGTGFKHGRIGHEIHWPTPPNLSPPGYYSENGGGG